MGTNPIQAAPGPIATAFRRHIVPRALPNRAEVEPIRQKRNGPREGTAFSETREGSRPAFAIDGDGTVLGPGGFVSYQPGTRHNSRTETGCVPLVCERGKEAAAT